MKWFAGIALSLVVLLLSWQNSRLRAETNHLVIENSSPRPGHWILSTQRIAALDVRSTAEIGKIYVFLEPTCSYCNASLPALENLHGAVKKKFGEGYSFFGISSQKYDLERGKISFPILTTSDPALLSYSRVYGTPLIVVTDSRGMIVHSRSGVLSNMEGVNGIVLALADMERSGASNEL